MDTWHSIPAPTAEDSSSDLMSVSSTSTEPEKSSSHLSRHHGQAQGRSRGRPRRKNESANNLINFTHPENNGLPPPPDNNQKYSCSICFKEFTALSSVQRHELTHTKNAKPFACDMCEQKFTQSSSLNTHKRAIHQGEKLFTCQICTKSFSKSYGLKMHLETHARKTIDVKGNRQQEQYSCSACPAIFFSFQYQIFVDHLQTIHGITYTGPKKQIESSEKCYSCTYCPMKYRKIQLFRDHLKCHKTRIEQEQEGQDGAAPSGIDDLIPTLVSAAAAARPMSEVPTGHGKLPLASATRVELLKHYDPTIELPSCATCGKSFTSLKTLQKHRKIHGERVRKYVCSVCSKAFSSPSDLRRHQKTLICGKKLKEQRQQQQQQGQDVNEEQEGGEKREKEFRNHLRSAESILCTICQKFFSKKSIRKHVRSVHLGKKEYVSKYCQQGFTQLIRCQRHEKTHEEEGICRIFTRSWQCPICGIEAPNFPSAYLANEHFMSKHNRELKIPVEKIVLKPVIPGEDETLGAWELCATCGNCYTVADYRLHQALCGDTPFHTRLAEGFGWRDEDEPEGVTGDEEAPDQPVEKKIKVSDKIFDDNNRDDQDQVDDDMASDPKVQLKNHISRVHLGLRRFSSRLCQLPSSLSREEETATSSFSAAEATADLQSQAEENEIHVKIEAEEDEIGGFDSIMDDPDDADDFSPGLFDFDEDTGAWDSEMTENHDLDTLQEISSPVLQTVTPVTPAFTEDEGEIFKSPLLLEVKAEPEPVQPMLTDKQQVDEEKEQECPLCGLIFENMLEFLAHDSLEHKRGAISLSRMSFKSLQDEPEYHSQCFHGISVLQASKDTLHIPWYTCEKCGKSCKLKSQILGHKRVALAAPDTCPPTQLDGIFKPKPVSNDPRIKVLDNGKAQCTICNKIYVNAYVAKQHLPAHEGKWVCPYCGRNLSGNATYRDHLSTHTGEKRYKCDKCDQAYLSATALHLHKRSAHENRIYECDLCPYSGKYEPFYHHVKTKHQNNSSAIKFRKTTKLVVDRETVVPSILACDQCPNIFKSRRKLAHHLATVHGQDEKQIGGYACEHCGKLIVDKTGLRRHILVFHRTDGLKVKFFSCKLCQKEYSLISSMRHHLRSAHAQEIPTQLLEQDMAHGEDPEGKSTVLDLKNYFVRLKPQKSGSNSTVTAGGVEHQSNDSNNSAWTGIEFN